LSKSTLLARHGGEEDDPMKYLILIYADESAWASFTPEEQAEGIGAYVAYREMLQGQRKHVISYQLNASSTAKTVKATDGKQQVADGPYADTKEQIGGFYLIEAEDDADALAWAARCPGAEHGIVELRPIIEH
jgi:hypothetical protein